MVFAMEGINAACSMRGIKVADFPAQPGRSESLGHLLHILHLSHRLALFSKRIIELGLTRRTSGLEDLNEDSKTLYEHLSASIEDSELVNVQKCISAVQHMNEMLTEYDSAPDITLPMISSSLPASPSSAGSEDRLGGDSHVGLSTEELHPNPVIPSTTRPPPADILGRRMRTLSSQVNWTLAQLHELEGKILDLRSDPSSRIFDTVLALDEVARRRKQQAALESYGRALTCASNWRQDGPKEGVLLSDWKSIKEKRTAMGAKVDAAHKNQETER